jgi:hypothetical protein
MSDFEEGDFLVCVSPRYGFVCLHEERSSYCLRKGDLVLVVSILASNKYEAIVNTIMHESKKGIIYDHLLRRNDIFELIVCNRPKSDLK